jgi:hypothetical protein
VVEDGDADGGAALYKDNRQVGVFFGLLLD